MQNMGKRKYSMTILELTLTSIHADRKERLNSSKQGKFCKSIKTIQLISKDLVNIVNYYFLVGVLNLKK